MKLKGKVAVITGGSRGIGKAIAIEFAKAGAAIIINYNKNDEEAYKTTEMLRGLGVYAISSKGDISDYNYAKNLIDFVIERFGVLDILVNNAGISKVNLFIDNTEKDWDDIIGINLKGTFNCSHNATKYMISKKKGCIINISSIWGEVGASCEVIYSASKGGINSFTKALAKELAPSSIRVNAIAPGVIDTEMNKWLTYEEKDELKNEIPMMKFGKTEDVAKLALFLASDDASYITGKVFTVDGGLL
ncbi:3-oxoacyl-[acyl-carrier-protein] reductase FabG [Clostridium tepidiprofundi DSM 19306]|uniref:3-oxoacyl-[acyl-carrier-protein] reductase FabG n=1 Tax=Clostridium tepidiprofundi DSM 19306 TaxID=1121338 RepID=A0A151B6F5_9CLOT|nr:SDR family oxidoreductase [Clostridium tepidiprofundi]KYH35360.1 3-oxoacyl-[acyl-carrier-protein] reductase FabG [Clostridium tepidiprofundi DSM 19306]